MVHVKKLFFVIALSLSAYSYSEIERPLSWQSRLYVDHVLVGKIWDSANQEFVSIEEFTSAIEESRYLILGEKHDNPDHHELQLAILNHLLDLNLVSLVAFEMMDSDFQERLDTLHSAKNQDSEALKEYLQWDEEGWEWLFYGPLIYSAYSSGVTIKASNLTNSRMMEIYGLSELPPELDIFDDITRRRLASDIDESHCGLLPESQFPSMIRVQQGRDYSMASSLSSRKDELMKILIAGNYHARKDLGVPKYLMANDFRLAADSIVSVSFMEVNLNETEPNAYLEMLGDMASHDFLWFTPVVSEEDYCASLR